MVRGNSVVVLVVVTFSTTVVVVGDPILVHALFRHGDRTTDSSLYANDPYKNVTYYPYGFGQLTNEGKNREYNLGRFLRGRYDKFLGDLYFPEIVDARSSDVNRTKMSLELVLAGAFPPKGEEIWNSALPLWQPIPYNYWPADKDQVLSVMSCPNFGTFLGEYSASTEVQKQNERYQSVFKYLAKYTGDSVTSVLYGYQLYFTLVTEQAWGLKLPEWTKAVFPDTLKEMALASYRLMTGTTNLRKVTAGSLLQKIVADTVAKINGTLEGRKLFLYSAHEINIGTLLNALDIPLTDVPTYGALVLVEVHLQGGVYGIKLFYKLGPEGKLLPLQLLGCQKFCPLERFASLVSKYFPDVDSCGTTS